MQLIAARVGASRVRRCLWLSNRAGRWRYIIAVRQKRNTMCTSRSHCLPGHGTYGAETQRCNPETARVCGSWRCGEASRDLSLWPEIPSYHRLANRSRRLQPPAPHGFPAEHASSSIYLCWAISFHLHLSAFNRCSQGNVDAFPISSPGFSGDA